MSLLKKIFLLALLSPLWAWGFVEFDLDQYGVDKMLSERSGPKGPKLDPTRIINQSNSFLKEREPEMTEEEYALYEKIVTIMGANAALAVQLLESMMNDKKPPSPAFDFILGNAYYNAGKIDLAEKRYRSAVGRYPNFVRAWNNLGVLCYTANRFPDAVNCFSKSIGLGDHEPLTFGLLGYSLERSEDYVSAEMAFMQALAGDPANADWKEGLMRICIQNKQYGRAETLVRNLVKDHPQEARYRLTQANVLLAENRKLDALVLLEAATATGAAGVEEMSLLGDLYAEQGLITEAIASYQKIRSVSALGGDKKLLTFARMLVVASKLPEAKVALDSLKGDLAPADRLVFLQTKADWFIAQKSFPQARQEIEALLKLAPFNGRALLTSGRIYVAEADIPRATFAFEAACQANDTQYLASLELANIELKNRHYAKSVEYLKKALAIEKSSVIEDYLALVETLVVTDGHSTQ